MKIALCLSGQPRWFEECSQYFKKNILDKFDHVDVFIHAWKEAGNHYETSIKDLKEKSLIKSNTEQLLQEIYKPTKIVIEPSIKFVDNESYLYQKSSTLPNNSYSMFYSLKKCIDLMESSEKERKIQYDWVFRSRFDYAINREFDEVLLSSLDRTSFYSPHVMTHNNPHCHCDFNFSGNETMKVFAKTFDNLENFGRLGIVLANESMSYKQLINSSIDVKQFDLFNQFPPSLHSSCWHSLWGHR